MADITLVKGKTYTNHPIMVKEVAGSTVLEFKAFIIGYTFSFATIDGTEYVCVTGTHSKIASYTATVLGTDMFGNSITYEVTIDVIKPAPEIPVKVMGNWKISKARLKIDEVWRENKNGWEKVAGVWRGLKGNESPSPTLSYDANGGSGSAPTNSVGIGLFSVSSNTFSRSGYRFSHWNTKADGSGTTYAPGATFTMSASTTLYAIWVKTYTLTYYKIYNHDYPTFYPPASNGGPVTNEDGRYLLDLQVNGARVDGLFDKFTESGDVSPTHTITCDEGSTIYVYVENDYTGDYCNIYLNGTKLSGPLEATSYTTTIQSNMTITFTWETEGTIFSNTQSYWDARITTG